MNKACDKKRKKGSVKRQEKKKKKEMDIYLIKKYKKEFKF